MGLCQLNYSILAFFHLRSGLHPLCIFQLYFTSLTLIERFKNFDCYQVEGGWFMMQENTS